MAPGLSLHGADGTEIDAWTSSDKPHRIEHLLPGTYTLREVMPPRTYDLAEDMTFEIKATGEVQTVAMKDAPIEIEGKVDKRQEIARPIGKGLVANGDGKNRAVAQSDADGSFSYTLDAKNESNTWVDEFTITDDLECAKEGTAKLIAIETLSRPGTSTVFATCGIERLQWEVSIRADRPMQRSATGMTTPGSKRTRSKSS